jgi:hypothetical protein
MVQDIGGETTMAAFRVFLVIIILLVGTYTGVVIVDHGINLFPVFFGDMAKLAWPGQFNLDFMCLLMLSGLWVAWRHGFSGGGVALGVLAFLLGAPFLSGYLLVASIQVRGEMRALLLGVERV